MLPISIALQLFCLCTGWAEISGTSETRETTPVDENKMRKIASFEKMEITLTRISHFLEFNFLRVFSTFAFHSLCTCRVTLYRGFCSFRKWPSRRTFDKFSNSIIFQKNWNLNSSLSLFYIFNWFNNLYIYKYIFKYKCIYIYLFIKYK